MKRVDHYRMAEDILETMAKLAANGKVTPDAMRTAMSTAQVHATLAAATVEPKDG